MIETEETDPCPLFVRTGGGFSCSPDSADSARSIRTRRPYLNLALPEPGPQGRVLTSTVMLELENVDA